MAWNGECVSNIYIQVLYKYTYVPLHIYPWITIYIHPLSYRRGEEKGEEREER